MPNTLATSLLFSFLVVTNSFLPSPKTRSHAFQLLSTATNDLKTANKLIQEIDQVVNRDSSTPPYTLIEHLESCNTISEPNREPSFLGDWHVWCTDCPPPSNGQLGPFVGTARQVIDKSGSYRNILEVPPNDWLTATLEGIWEEWDGTLLDVSDDNDPTVDRDWGAEHWKVTFLTLQIYAFGFPLFTKTFDAGTARVWRTTYLDDRVRIVRAGKTGRIQDEVVFYTKRAPKEQ